MERTPTRKQGEKYDKILFLATWYYWHYLAKNRLKAVISRFLDSIQYNTFWLKGMS